MVIWPAQAISFRTPYQGNATLRKQINSGEVRFVDMHLSSVPQNGATGISAIHWAVVEACDVTAGGGIVLSVSGGIKYLPASGRQDHY